MISIFGKSWDLHTKRALGITEEENLALIGETVAYLKAARQRSRLRCRALLRRLCVESRISHCEHLKPRKKMARMCSACATPTAERCHTRIAEVVRLVKARFGGVIGIHAHNDSDTAVANTLAGGRSRRDACAGLHERLWRAVRQREHRQRYRKSRTEDGARDRRPCIDCPN